MYISANWADRKLAYASVIDQIRVSLQQTWSSYWIPDIINREPSQLVQYGCRGVACKCIFHAVCVNNFVYIIDIDCRLPIRYIVALQTFDRSCQNELLVPSCFFGFIQRVILTLVCRLDLVKTNLALKAKCPHRLLLIINSFAEFRGNKPLYHALTFSVSVGLNISVLCSGFFQLLKFYAEKKQVNYFCGFSMLLYRQYFSLHYQSQK